jgi:hypothetical protein
MVGTPWGFFLVGMFWQSAAHGLRLWLIVHFLDPVACSVLAAARMIVINIALLDTKDFTDFLGQRNDDMLAGCFVPLMGFIGRKL